MKIKKEDKSNQIYSFLLVEKVLSNPLECSNKTNTLCRNFEDTNMMAEFQISGMKISTGNKTFVKCTGQFSLSKKLQTSNMEVTKKEFNSKSY